MRVEQAERALLELARALDRAFQSDSRFHHVVIALGQRSRSLYMAFVHCMEGPAPVASMAILRPLVEINILVRFLGQAPDIRSWLWMAERSRWSLAFVGDVAADPALSARFSSELPSEAVLARWRSEVEDARDAALAEGVPGVRERGALIPTIAEQVRLLDNPVVTEAYVFAYRRFSGDVHAGMLSFDSLNVDESYGEGFLALSDDAPASALRPTRLVGLTTFASTLRVVGDAVGLDIGDAADRVRLEFMSPDWVDHA